jgi:hypothetical protein
MCEGSRGRVAPVSTDYIMRALFINKPSKGNKQKKPVCGLVLCGRKVGSQM